MAGEAVTVVRRFWTIQDGGDYTALVELFAEEARLEDPIYGVFQGKSAIGAFMERMNTAMRERGVRFEAVEIAGGEDAAWARWVARTPNGDRDGVGVYKVAAGKIVYYRDYLDPASQP